MTLSEGQVSVRSLVMGAGTSYELMNDFSMWARNVRADQGGPRAWNHGTWSGAEWQDEAVIPMQILVKGSGVGGWLSAHQALAAAFAPSATDVELRTVVGGVEYLMLGRPRMVQPDTSLVGGGISFTRVAFVAQDPRIYSGVLHTTGTLNLPVLSGGLQVAFTVPFTVNGALVGGSASLVNAGTTDTGLTMRIDGPVVAPRISLQRPDGLTQTLTIGFDLSTGDWINIDTIARTVMLNGFSSRRAQVSGDWPILPAGTSTLSFASSTYNASAALSASWRDAWW